MHGLDFEIENIISCVMRRCKYLDPPLHVVDICSAKVSNRYGWSPVVGALHEHSCTKHHPAAPPLIDVVSASKKAI